MRTLKHPKSFNLLGWFTEACWVKDLTQLKMYCIYYCVFSALNFATTNKAQSPFIEDFDKLTTMP